VQGLLERIAAADGQRGKVVLVTSRQPGSCTDVIARSLNLTAVNNGMMSALIQVQNDAALSRGADVTIQSTAPQGPRASRAALHAVGLLIDAGRDTGPEGEDIRAEFALVVVDAPSLVEQPDVVALASHVDVIVLVEREGASDTKAIRETIASLSTRTSAAIGVVVDQAVLRSVPATAIAS
jgi:Mrp family chromosome partitioning ATPase